MVINVSVLLIYLRNNLLIGEPVPKKHFFVGTVLVEYKEIKWSVLRINVGEQRRRWNTSWRLIYICIYVCCVEVQNSREPINVLVLQC